MLLVSTLTRHNIAHCQACADAKGASTGHMLIRRPESPEPASPIAQSRVPYR